MPINKVENKAPEKSRADFFRKSNLLISCTSELLVKKEMIDLTIRNKSSNNKGIEPINLALNKTKNKLVYITLSLM